MKQKATITIFLAFFSISGLLSQQLYVGNNAEFFVASGTVFTTSNTVVTTGATGIFSVGAGSNWGSNQEYVDGKVTGYGTGITKLPIGTNSIYAPVTADHTGTVEGIYYNATPFTGTLGTNVDAKSDIEYWELTGNATITLPWDSHSDMTTLVNNNGGSINSIAVVGLNGSTWNLVSASQTNTVTGNLTQGNVTTDSAVKVNLNGFSQFTFGIDHQVVLAIDDLLLNTDIVLLNNPVQANTDILFRTSNITDNLNVTLFDIRGRTLQKHTAIKLDGGVGTIPSTNLASGIYVLKFEHEGKLGVKKIIIQ